MKRTRSDLTLGYLRCSTDEQADSGLGLAAQRATIEAEAQRRGWDVRFMMDDGFSAKSLSRPAIADALGMLARGEASTLCVSRLDRLSRSILDMAGLMQTAQREGWQLVVLDLGVDTTTPSGALVAQVMASFAEYERRIIGKRTSDALQELKASGKRLGRPRTLDQGVTDRIVTERAGGRTLADIAAGLTADGVVTARGGAWRPSTIAAVLKSAALDAEAVA